jgi:uncharacterized membrane protein YkoI
MKPEDPMKHRTWTRAALALALAGVAGAAGAQTPATTEAGVETALRMAGYSEIRDIDLDGDEGLWEAEVLGEDGLWQDVHVVQATGEVLAVGTDEVALLDAAQVTDALTAAGYTEVRDLDRDEAVWEADARNANGAEVELKVNARTGAIVHERLEEEDAP